MSAKEKKEEKAQDEAPPKEEAPESKAEAAEKPVEATPVQTLEKHYPELKLKNGEVFLKRRRGKPRIRKIVAKNHAAQLFMHDRGKWTQKSVYPPKGKPVHNLRWHLRNKWDKVDKAQIEK